MRTRMRGRLASGGLGAALLLSACEVPPTQLVVVIRTDMDIPEELDGFTVQVTGPGTVAERGPFALTGAPPAVLPATFGIRPKGGDADRRVRVSVTARRQGLDLFTTHAATTFLDERSLQLDVFLAERCIVEALDCVEPGVTCTEDGCVPEDRDPDDLPDWRGLPATDAGAPDAGSHCGDGVEPGRWAAPLGTGEGITGGDLVLDAAGNTHVVGLFRGTVSFQGQPAVTARVDSSDAYWICFDPLGCPCWDAPRIFSGGEGHADLVHAAMAPGDELVVAASVADGAIVLGGQVFDGAGLVARFSREGELLQGVTIDASGGWSPTSVAVTDAGGVLVSGITRDSFRVIDPAEGPIAGNVPTTASAVVVLWDADLSNPRIGTVSSTVDLSESFAAEAPDGTIVMAGSLDEGTLTVNGIAGDLASRARSFVAAFAPADLQVRWAGPVLGGAAGQPHLVAVTSAIHPLAFAATVFPPEASLGVEAIPVAPEQQSDVVVAGMTEDGAVSPLALVGNDVFMGLTDACAVGGGPFLVGGWGGGQGFVIAMDEDRRELRRVEGLAGTPSRVAVSPNGDVVVLLGVLLGESEVGGRRLPRGLFVHSLDPTLGP